MARSHLSKSPAVVPLTAARLLGGCPDPDGKYDEFLERVGDGNGGVEASCDPTVFHPIDGEFLMAIDTPLGRGNPLLFRVTIETNLDGTGACPATGCAIVRFDAQPLVPFNRANLNAACSASGEPVGDLIRITDIAVDGQGRFRADFGQQSVNGCANPITGRDIVATIVLEGLTASPDIFAGDARGIVSQPLQATLNGSTFAAVRIVGDELDRDPPLTCAEAVSLIKAA